MPGRGRDLQEATSTVTVRLLMFPQRDKISPLLGLLNEKDQELLPSKAKLGGTPEWHTETPTIQEQEQP